MTALVIGSTTWTELVAIEPRLAEVEQRAIVCRRRRHNNWIAYEALKTLLQRYVGFNAEQGAMRRSDYYDIAHRHILAAWEGR